MQKKYMEIAQNSLPSPRKPTGAYLMSCRKKQNSATDWNEEPRDFFMAFLDPGVNKREKTCFRKNRYS